MTDEQAGILRVCVDYRVTLTLTRTVRQAAMKQTSTMIILACSCLFNATAVAAQYYS